MRTISSSILVCSCLNDFGDVGMSCLFFLGLVPAVITGLEVVAVGDTEESENI